jgi:hypothetical protein
MPACFNTSCPIQAAIPVPCPIQAPDPTPKDRMACFGGSCFAEGCACADLSETGEACGYHSTMGADCSNCHNCPQGWIMGMGWIGASGTCSATCGSTDSEWEDCGLPAPPADSLTRTACDISP